MTNYTQRWRAVGATSVNGVTTVGAASAVLQTQTVQPLLATPLTSTVADIPTVVSFNRRSTIAGCLDLRRPYYGPGGSLLLPATPNLSTSAGNSTTIGNATGNFQLTSNGLNVTTAGAISGATTISASGLVTSVGLNAGAGLIQVQTVPTVVVTPHLLALPGNTFAAGNSTGAVTQPVAQLQPSFNGVTLDTNWT